MASHSWNEGNSSDNWTTRDNLSLASAVQRIGDRNWLSVTRALKPIGERRPEWYTPKKCAHQYSKLLQLEDKKDKRSRSEKEIMEDMLVKKLHDERIKELDQRKAECLNMQLCLEKVEQQIDNGYFDNNENFENLTQEMKRFFDIWEAPSSSQIYEVKVSPPVKGPLKGKKNKLAKGKKMSVPECSIKQAPTEHNNSTNIVIPPSENKQATVSSASNTRMPVSSLQSFFNPSIAMAIAAGRQSITSATASPIPTCIPKIPTKRDLSNLPSLSVSIPTTSSPVTSVTLSAPTLSKLLETPLSISGKLPLLPTVMYNTPIISTKTAHSLKLVKEKKEFVEKDVASQLKSATNYEDEAQNTKKNVSADNENISVFDVISKSAPVCATTPKIAQLMSTDISQDDADSTPDTEVLSSENSSANFSSDNTEQSCNNFITSDMQGNKKKRKRSLTVCDKPSKDLSSECPEDSIELISVFQSKNALKAADTNPDTCAANSTLNSDKNKPKSPVTKSYLAHVTVEDIMEDAVFAPTQPSTSDISASTTFNFEANKDFRKSITALKSKNSEQSSEMNSLSLSRYGLDDEGSKTLHTLKEKDRSAESDNKEHLFLSNMLSQNPQSSSTLLANKESKTSISTVSKLNYFDTINIPLTKCTVTKKISKPTKAQESASSPRKSKSSDHYSGIDREIEKNSVPGSASPDYHQSGLKKSISSKNPAVYLDSLRMFAAASGVGEITGGTTSSSDQSSSETQSISSQSSESSTVKKLSKITSNSGCESSKRSSVTSSPRKAKGSAQESTTNSSRSRSFSTQGSSSSSKTKSTSFKDSLQGPRKVKASRNARQNQHPSSSLFKQNPSAHVQSDQVSPSRVTAYSLSPIAKHIQISATAKNEDLSASDESLPSESSDIGKNSAVASLNSPLSADSTTLEDSGSLILKQSFERDERDSEDAYHDDADDKSYEFRDSTEKYIHPRRTKSFEKLSKRPQNVARRASRGRRGGFSTRGGSSPKKDITCNFYTNDPGNFPAIDQKEKDSKIQTRHSYRSSRAGRRSGKRGRGRYANRAQKDETHEQSYSFEIEDKYVEDDKHYERKDETVSGHQCELHESLKVDDKNSDDLISSSSSSTVLASEDSAFKIKDMLDQKQHSPSALSSANVSVTSDSSDDSSDSDSSSHTTTSESTSQEMRCFRKNREAQHQHKRWKKSISMIWREASCHKYANVFLQKVTDDVAPGYHNIVYRPMDLTMIKRNIDNDAIFTTEEFQRDMMLMFQNAIMYNSSDHDVYQMAVTMQRDVNELIQLTAEEKNKQPTVQPTLRHGRHTKLQPKGQKSSAKGKDHL